MKSAQPTLGIWRGASDTPDPYSAITRLKLERNIAELEAHGYTIVEPEKAAAPGFAAELEEAILKVAEKRGGARPDRLTGESHQNLSNPAGQHLYNMLLEGPIFEKAMMNEVLLALVSYVVGYNCLLSSMTAMVKGPGEANLDLHADVLFMPPPFPAWATVVNATWALTDYDRENGSTYFWPGSHRFCRQPTAAERENTAALTAVTARAGSLLVWHGNTWHGAFARKRPGLRVNLINLFSRPFMFRQEDYRDTISQEAIARNDPRFARLIGRELPFPMGVDGPDRPKLMAMNAALQTQWG